jgi:cytochrome c peroxidase
MRYGKARMVRRLQAIAVLWVWLINGAAWGGTQLPLSRVQVPEPPNLNQFVADRNAAIRLGKALFWDMQAGSDGIQACASCHYRAGADPIDIRSTNQLNPGPGAIFDVGSGPGYTLAAADFPFLQVSPVDGRVGNGGTIIRNVNDIVGSQGIHKTTFTGVIPGSAVDSGTPNADALFNIGGINVRQVTGRNTPPAVNAVFNYANFWDGRANNIFNGNNPLGPLDVDAGIWIEQNLALVKQKVAISNASLASQATGPPLSSVEMSFAGRTFPELGRKMLSLTPLGKQRVHPNDNVLGSLSKATLQGDGTVTGNPGLNTTYIDMIKAAFQAYLWNSGKTVTLPAGLKDPAHPLTDQFSQMEANFSLFWGLAIQLYEATLVSDRTPFDRFQAGNQNSLGPAAQRGLAVFDSKCAVCHAGSELSTAAVGSDIPRCLPPNCNRLAFTNNTSHRLIQQNLTAVPGGLSDTGFFNIGVRPTTDDPGRGGTINFPLSFSRLAELQAGGQLPFVTPLLPTGIAANAPVDVDGAFKVPGLRNVELTAPYFHNGSALTLDQVVEFYTRGGNFANPQLAVAIQPIGKLRGNPTGRADLVEFLKSLTDERVRNEWAPFDHPELQIPSGDLADTMITRPVTGGAPVPVAPALTLNPVPASTDQTTLVLTGTVDSTATVAVTVNNLSPAFATVACTIDPVTAQCAVTPPPTSIWSLTITGLAVGLTHIAVTATSTTGGTANAAADVLVTPIATIGGLPPGGRTAQNNFTLTIGGAGVVSYQYSLDGGAFSADIPVATPIVLTAMADGTHIVAVFGKDGAGNRQVTATTASWTVKAIPPVLTLKAPISPTRGTSQTISGTVELGSVPAVTVDTGATVGPVRTVGGNGISTWSCDITGLAAGTNNITVKALDFVFNVTTVTGAITVILPDGNLKGSGSVDVSDALMALRIAVGLVQPSPEQMLHGDVAPLVNGVPAPDNRIDIADALVILRKVVGLINF